MSEKISLDSSVKEYEKTIEFKRANKGENKKIG